MALLTGRTASILAAVLLCSACLPATLAVFDKSKCKLAQYNVDEATSRAYYTIDTYLNAAVKTDDPKENFYRAGQWLKIEEDPVSDEPLVAALRRFTALSKLKCDEESYTLLMQNHCVITPKPLDRIERVIKAIAEKHMKDCKGAYKGLFTAKLKKLDAQTLHQIMTYIDRMLLQVTSATANPKTDSFMRLTNEDLWNKFLSKSARIAYQSMESLSNEEGYMNFIHQVHDYKKGTLTSSRVMDLFKLYLVDSCEKYVKYFSPIFLPAEFDSSGEPFYDEIDRSNFDQHWARFRLCHSFLNNDQTELKKDVLAIAKKAFN